MAITFLVSVTAADNTGQVEGTTFLIGIEDDDSCRIIGEAPVTVELGSLSLPPGHFVAIASPAFPLR